MTVGVQVDAETSADGFSVRWSDVDGVPVAWVPSPRSDRLGASLLFRVGTADEALFFHGVTHLVEHLALFGVGRPPHYMNGATTSTITSFVTSGTPTEVVEFFRTLCGALRQLPVERFESEARVIETESVRRGLSVSALLMLKRYGPTGPGLAAMGEFAARSMTPAHLQGWANTRMNRGNAVLVLDGPPPADLRLELPEGVRYAPTQLTPLTKYLPGWFEHKGNDVAFSAVVSRTAALPALVYALNDALTRRLRDDLAMSYSPVVFVDEYDGQIVHLVGATDAHPEYSQRALDATIEALGRLARMGPDPKVLNEFRSRYGRVPEDAKEIAPWAMWEAQRHLLCMPHQRAADGIAQACEVTGEQVRNAAAEALSSVIYAVPDGCRLPISIAQPLPKHYSGPVLKGPIVPSVDTGAAGDEATLTLATDGLMHQGRMGYTSVLYRDCVAAFAWPDGGREIISRTGARIRIEPGRWTESATVVAAVDAGTAAVRVAMPARDFVPHQRPAPRSPSIETAASVADPGGRSLRDRLQLDAKGGRFWMGAVLAFFGVAGGVAAPPGSAVVGASIAAFVAGVLAMVWPASPTVSSTSQSKNRYTIPLTKVTSIGCMTWRRTVTYTGTPAQLRRIYGRTLLHNLALGWWGFPSESSGPGSL